MPSVKPVVILQHVANEDAGTILDFLKSRGIPYTTVLLYEKSFELPAADSIRALIVMGGPMNVYEEEKYPFLVQENLFIKEAIRNNVPYLGICLGAQLLAKALGSRVYKASAPEVGWGLVRLSPEAKKDRFFGAIDTPNLKVLQWHEDTFDLPAGATLLASSSVVSHQAYRYKDRFWGLQFHLEVNRPMLENWFKDRPDVPGILETFESYRPKLSKITDGIYSALFL